MWTSSRALRNAPTAVGGLAGVMRGHSPSALTDRGTCEKHPKTGGKQTEGGKEKGSYSPSLPPAHALQHHSSHPRVLGSPPPPSMHTSAPAIPYTQITPPLCTLQSPLLRSLCPTPSTHGFVQFLAPRVPSILTVTTQGLSSPPSLLSPLDEDWHPSVCSKAALFRALGYAVPSRNFIQGAEHSQRRAFQALRQAQALFSLRLCARHHDHFLLRSCFLRARRELALIPTPRRTEAAWVRRAPPTHCRGPYKCLSHCSPTALRVRGSPVPQPWVSAGLGRAPCGAPGETLSTAPMGIGGISARRGPRSPAPQSGPALGPGSFSCENSARSAVGAVLHPTLPRAWLFFGDRERASCSPLGQSSGSLHSPSGTEHSERCVFLRLTCECCSQGVSHLMSQRFYIFSFF